MRRAVKLNLKYVTDAKRRRINALVQAYRAAVNFYIRSLWNERGKLNKETLARLPDDRTRLSSRYKSQALKQALETVVSTKRSAKELGVPFKRPIFNGAATLDAKFVSVCLDKPSSYFDVFVRLSSLQKGRKITIPTKGTRVLRKWLNRPGASLVQGCSLSENHLIVWVECPAPEKTNGDDLGVDIGMCKLMSLSDGAHLGMNFRQVRDRVNRRKAGSKGKGQARRHRDQFIKQQVNRLPWYRIRMIAVEDLKNLKKGKKKSRGKNFRKATAPWSYRQVIEAIGQKAEEYGVHLVAVPPQFTSRTCPKCGTESSENRKGEVFRCVDCDYTADADTVGATNILSKALCSVGSVESPAFIAS